MTDTASNLPRFGQGELPDRTTQADILANRHTEGALEQHKREGLVLAARARLLALGIIAVMLPFLNPNPEVLYYEALLGLLMLNGLAQQRVGRVGRSGLELGLLFVDLALMTFALVVPNPFDDSTWPAAMGYRFGNAIYFFVILAAGTLSYSWRTIVSIGTWMAGLWAIGLGYVWWFGRTVPEMTTSIYAAFPDDPQIAKLLDPNSANLDFRVQEVVIFVIVASILAVSVRRFNRLLLSNAVLERQRENLSRYFSPNVVEELSSHDEPLSRTRMHDVAVLFVDIVGFTEYTLDRDPQEVIETLRQFHARMETEVFAHGGTLDKYLGDGLMATFGTPVAGVQDATNALHCARAMLASVEQWNAERIERGEAAIRTCFGLHYGPVVLGDIGANRLEFAVIGTTVNVASRLEKLTRDLNVKLAISDASRVRVNDETKVANGVLDGFVEHPGQKIRGLDRDITVWSLG